MNRQIVSSTSIGFDRPELLRSYYAIHKFDIANLHVRTDPGNATPIVVGWRHYLAHRGFSGPLWVTETGYPADPRYQLDPYYQGGGAAQARYLAAIIPKLLCVTWLRSRVRESGGILPGAVSSAAQPRGAMRGRSLDATERSGAS